MSVLCPVRNASEGIAPVLRAGSEVDAAAFSEIRRRALLEGCKWDSQVGDVTTLAPFPLIIGGGEWRKISALAESLASEGEAAANEILRRPELLRALGLPRALRQVLAKDAPLSPSAGHVVRFDFHLTTDGWRISEANSDVPGGFSEATHFTAMMARHFPALRMAGEPASVWADSLAATVGANGTVALLSAPGFMEDHQVVSFLAGRLRERGCRAHTAGPRQIAWRDGAACLDTAWHRGPLDAIVRFYQAEWIARSSIAIGWSYFFRGGKTRVAAPCHGVITESKRFPLTWDALRTPVPTWRSLLPETRPLHATPWAADDGWLIKTAMCNTGDTVSARGWMPERDWRKVRMSALFFPGKWVAQRRFASVPVATPLGPRHACIGVYTVNGKAAGAYARLSEKPVIDFAAMDVALLVDENDD